ncbi:hypothetical protein [Aliiglaciecola sp. LCG003]|uniref:hypothetical protein n=1 Tax=Aliiglaciecola sp. LCG003 TaxID=3053655 RepID=UPI00257394BC|nr:hypothetical protein [Aliiglaciecola sp. LCG003]WJG09685.1 hypothetical protein QR722_01210 [Aliiglaciecola sp. LCG003]
MALRAQSKHHDTGKLCTGEKTYGFYPGIKFVKPQIACLVLRGHSGAVTFCLRQTNTQSRHHTPAEKPTKPTGSRAMLQFIVPVHGAGLKRLGIGGCFMWGLSVSLWVCRPCCSLSLVLLIENAWDGGCAIPQSARQTKG